MAGGFDVEHEELWNLICMECVEASFECWQLVGDGLEDEERFSGRLDFALPAVDGFDGWDERDAGDQLLFNEGVGEAASFVGVGAGGQDETDGWGEHGVIQSRESQ